MNWFQKDGSRQPAQPMLTDAGMSVAFDLYRPAFDSLPEIFGEREGRRVLTARAFRDFQEAHLERSVRPGNPDGSTPWNV